MNSKPFSWPLSRGVLRHGASVLVCVIALAVAVLLSATTIATAQVVAPSQPDQATALEVRTVYLPLAVKNFDPALPTLLAPQDGAQLDTLIPVFAFDAGVQPPSTAGVLDFGTDPDPNRPVTWQASFGLESGAHWELRTWYNLQPSTTYYWRVGVIYDYNYTVPPRWSSQFSFTTAPAGGPLPSAPSLTSPTNGSVVSADNVVLHWTSTPQAVEYQILVHDLVRGWRYGYSTSMTELDITGSPVLLPGNRYEWYVAARTDYGWGPSSATWRFDVAATANSSAQPKWSDAYLVWDARTGRPTTYQLR